LKPAAVLGTNNQSFTIVSGGQTGADSAALDFALAAGLPHAGYCPNGRLAEDGTLSNRYRLQETALADYSLRTEKNVVLAQATVIFTLAKKPTGGSKDTIAFAVAHERPCLHLSAMDDQPEKKLVTFIRKNKVRILNVAGSRESKEPGIYSFTLNVLSQLFHPVALLKTKF